MLLPFPSALSISSNLADQDFEPNKPSKPLKGGRPRTIILNYVKSSSYLLGNLIKLGHLFFAHDSLYQFSYQTFFFFYCMFLATLRLYIKAQETQRFFFFKEAFGVKEEIHAGFFFLLGS